jgi:hypothetical protein
MNMNDVQLESLLQSLQKEHNGCAQLTPAVEIARKELLALQMRSLLAHSFQLIGVMISERRVLDNDKRYFFI